MPIPDYQSLMRPLLHFAQDGTEKNIREAIAALALQFRLSEAELRQLQPSGRQEVFSNRVHWARTYLDKAGAIRRTRRSHFSITDRGRKLLRDNPEHIDVKTLRQFTEFVEFQAPRSSEEDVLSGELTVTEVAQEAATPEEAIDQAELQISATLKSQILERVHGLSAMFFEKLVVDLIVAMGYGGSRNSVAKRLGKSGDEGIDGVVNQDPLGLDVVYLQAKRYAAENTVGRERIQQFAGALVGQAASKGVFVTTSSFSKGAIEYVQKIPQKVILIDGDELTRLMLQHGVGIRLERTIEIKRIDSDYFEENED